MIPQDPHMLLSFVNMKLRDYYSDIDILCADINVSRKEIEEKLQSIGYSYSEEKNQFL